ILSRITEPTTGHARICGRVGSLLEGGTGFHPELTGRENVFLNGAILGMTRAEIERNFDEIVGFSEVERFIDTPVKRYSSGMAVRLAFAVAAASAPGSFDRGTRARGRGSSRAGDFDRRRGARGRRRLVPEAMHREDVRGRRQWSDGVVRQP